MPTGRGRGNCGVADMYAPPAGKLRNYAVVGITKDSTGGIVANASVEVFETLSKQPRGGGVSDESGNYRVMVNDPNVGLTFYVVAYKVGSPDLAGTTVNTLIGIEQ